MERLVAEFCEAEILYKFFLGLMRLVEQGQVFAVCFDEMAKKKNQRDAAWEWLHKILTALNLNPEGTWVGSFVEHGRNRARKRLPGKKPTPK